MGQVWQARDTKLDRNVALKVLEGGRGRHPSRIVDLTLTGVV